MAIDHEGARRLMAEAMEGRLDSDDERELALHLIGCEECKGIYEGLQQAHPALESIELGYASTQALDAAVHRAVTVLKGEADPGPHGLTEEPPKLPEDAEAPTVRIDSGTSHLDEDILVPAGPSTTTGPMTPVTPPSVEQPTLPPPFPIEVPEAHVRPILPEVASEPPGVAEAPEDAGEPPVEFAPPPQPQAPIVEAEPAPIPIGPRSEIESLLDEDRARYEPAPVPQEYEEDDRVGRPGPWLFAIAVTVVLAVLAGVLITRGPGLFGGSGDLPSASEVRSRVQRSVREMKSLKASFDIRKLNLYRTGREQNSLLYTFANGHYTGRMVYDRAEGYKQTFTLTVGDEERERVEITQTSDETQSLVGSGDDRTHLVEENPPLGPPDGNLRPSLGILEDSLGAAATLIASSKDLEVARRRELDGREVFEVRGTIRPTELSRGDEIEAALDAASFLPVIVKRSISKDNARVLGPAAALSDQDIDSAFGNNENVTTELMQLEDVSYDELVLPNELVLDVPDGVEDQRSNARFERVTRAGVSSLSFRPLLPRTLPNGFEEQLFAVYRGEPRNWGPGRTLPKPKNVFHASYFDGKTTIVVTERQMDDKFDLDGSPLARSGLPITVRDVERDGKPFFFGVSPEVPPHVYGFLGNTFVMAVGYAEQSELLRVVASLTQTPGAVPGSGAETSPRPTGSPGSSPTTSPGASTPGATGSPGASP